MTRSWSGSHEFASLSGELATSEERDFERKALPLIRVIWPEAVGAPSLRSFDRSGIDHLVWSDSQPIPLVIQCKGFRSSEHEIGSAQIDQCRKSIESFRNSGVKAQKYVLLHNRDGRNKGFRDTIHIELDNLVDSGQVSEAVLWDRHTFINNAFNKLFDRLLPFLSNALAESTSTYAEAQICQPLEMVPLSIAEIVVNQYRLERQSDAASFIGDPSAEILKGSDSNIVLLIAEAGYGKTTAALRTFNPSVRRIFYVPGAMIPKTVVGSKDLLSECLNVEGFLLEMADADQPALRRLVRPVMEYILKDNEQSIVLIIDGLDESVYFSRPGGLQSLFNQLRAVEVPIVLLARSEFWATRMEDFATSFGALSKVGHRKRTKMKLVELHPWAPEQIGHLAERFRDELTLPQQRARVSDFIEVVRSGKYESYYGDIPRRPLFLRFILETVAEHGVRRVGRGSLYYDWAVMKVRRDISRPRVYGKEGRLGILPDAESAAITLKLSFRAMMLTAGCMTLLRGDAIELLPECKVQEVLSKDPTLSRICDPTGLFLNSLLIPLPKRLVHEDFSVRFAHRTYQEFFLALYCREYPDEFEGIELPESVREIMGDFERESLATET